MNYSRLIPNVEDRATLAIILPLSRRIISNYDTACAEQVIALPDAALVGLHYLVARRAGSMKKLVQRHAYNLRCYLETLTRHHVGLFWKIFNRFYADLSARWYRTEEGVGRLILKSLLCCDERNGVGSAVWEARVLSLDAIFGCKVQPVFGTSLPVCGYTKSEDWQRRPFPVR